MLIIFIFFFIGLFTFRRLWINYCFQKYCFDAIYWCNKTKQEKHVYHEVSQLWPLSHILWELWRWNFGRYVVYTSHYQSMNEFINAEKKLNHLGHSEFMKGMINRQDSQLISQKNDQDSISGPN